jgi:uroporphyrinogen-III synthase
MELQFENMYCVGKRTKRLIEKKIGKVSQDENSAEKLANYLVKNLSEKEVTFFCGNKKREELSNILNENNIVVNEVESYQTALTPRKIDEKINGILFFSPSAIESFLTQNKATDIVAFCIGETTATEARKYFKNVEVSKVSTIESVIETANEYFKVKE